ncbi:ABC transporter ATP-binding protein [Clostridium senegalense]|uniref:ABC transporter ATP-binding protein n=1 Tax=Clostridium senegalense TaxID=1465809 RepID=UPI001C11E7C7|nr:ABC transporter ATP-binding protein [Clostridium senegalense]MBU5226828.1 ABC transporter ATP-binding protein [Clostridium senegalense]
MKKTIVMENVSKTIKRKKLLSNVSFEVAGGEITGFIGPNGAGKTTTIKILTGLIRPSSGTAYVNGKDISKSLEGLKDMGAMVEYPIFYPYLTGEENLRVLGMIDNLEKRKREERIKEVIELVNLKGREKDKIKEYSLGMKQRLGIAQALLKNPEILILDEPTNGLDPIGMKELRDIIVKINKEYKKTIFISSHLLDELQQICDNFIIINNGEILFEGTKQSLLKKGEKLEDAFLNILRGEKLDKII